MEKYTTEKPLGAGNYGEVSLVRSISSGALFVAKRINLQSKTPQQRKEAENEVRTMSRLNHPNIVGFVEAFVADETLHIIMEYADGTDLEQELISHCKHKRFLTEDKIMYYFVQISLGLRQLHKQHLLHRDLKSANVFLTSNKSVKLGDFGFAKQLNYTMALTTTVCGTPYYFSPELCQKLPYNNKSDVWSLGVILYEMINLQKPFEAKSLQELRKRVVAEEPLPFTATHISPELKDLCLWLLRKSSSARPSVEAVLQSPYVRKYLSKFSAYMQQQQQLEAKKASDIAKEHPRAPNEPRMTEQAPRPTTSSSSPPPLQGGTQKMIVDKNAFRAGPPPPSSAPPVPHAPTAPPAASLYSRAVPDGRDVVSNQCPIEIVGELTHALIAEEGCKALRNDVEEVLKYEDVDEAIGEAETDEERQLREQLGDRFVKCIELALRLAELPSTSVEADQILKQLLALLGSKEYLLPDVQKVATFFEVNPS